MDWSCDKHQTVSVSLGVTWPLLAQVPRPAQHDFRRRTPGSGEGGGASGGWRMHVRLKGDGRMTPIFVSVKLIVIIT